MDKPNECAKKCYCARCFLPIDAEDKVDIEEQNFHRICSMCCICRTLPTSLKMFYGHVFCSDCFKNHVLTRFRGESPRIQSNSWWMQWAPGAKPQEGASESKVEEAISSDMAEEQMKRPICSRCLQAVNDGNMVDIGGQSFHTQCAKCYFCHTVPRTSPKIYYGQLFCEECFHKHVLGRSRDNPSEFFKTCFEQWQNNPQFAENMRYFMAGGNNTPIVMMMHGQQAPFCRCGTNPPDSAWIQDNEPKKCTTVRKVKRENVTAATPATASMCGDSICTWDLTFENRTEVSDVPESCNDDLEVAAEKIEKLTKFLHENQEKVSRKQSKKWESTDDSFDPEGLSVLMDPARLQCPRCLWQCGPIYVNGEFISSGF